MSRKKDLLRICQIETCVTIKSAYLDINDLALSYMDLRFGKRIGKFRNTPTLSIDSCPCSRFIFVQYVPVQMHRRHRTIERLHITQKTE